MITEVGISAKFRLRKPAGDDLAMVITGLSHCPR